jgi:nucleoside-diphosphate-sugar epimerase/predicted dehydrogenase
MLRCASPDVVHVLTPPRTHADLAVLAANAGCHVLVEKPFALCEADARRIVHAAEANGVVTSVCHNMAFKPSVLEGRRLLAEGTIGEVVSVSSFWGGIALEGAYAGPTGGHWAWRLPGGLFTNFLPHLISLQQAFMGCDLTVKGASLSSDPREVGRLSELLVAVEAEHVVGSMGLSLRAQPKTTFVDVYGTAGTLHIDLVREVCVLLPRRTAPGPITKVAYSYDYARQLTAGSVRSVAKVLRGQLGGNPGMPRLVDDFYRSLRTGDDPPVPPRDAIAATAVLDALWKAEPRLVEPLRPAGAGFATSISTEPLALPHPGPARSFVTGAAGFLGRHLSAALHQLNVPVVALVREPNRAPFELEHEATIVRGDLSDVDALVEAMAGCDVVFHCAAITGNQVPLDVATEDNARGTERVCEAAAKAGVRRVVHVSSVAVYGLDHPRGTRLDERAPLQPGGAFEPYQASKVEAERAARRRSSELGLELVVVRPGVLYGPGHPIRAGLVSLGTWRVCIGTGRNRMPYTFVGNAVDALLLSATVPEAAGETFNVVDDPAVRVRDVLAVADPDAHVLPVPVPVALAGAGWLEERRRRAGSDIAPKLSRFTVRGASRDVAYDTTKAERILGWRPRISLTEGVRRSRPG